MVRRVHRLSVAAFVCGAAAAGALGACSSSPSKPAICSSLDSLKASVHNLTRATPGQNALTEFQNDVAAVRADADKVVKDAKSQYAPQINALKTDLSGLQAALDAAQASPSASSLGAVLAVTVPMQRDLARLSDAVKSSC